MALPDVGRQWEFENMCRALEATQRILKLAGAPEPTVQLDEFSGIAPELVRLDKVFSDSRHAGPIEFSFNWPTDAPIPSKLDFLYANFVRMNDVTIVHYSVARMVPQGGKGRIVWRSTEITPGEISFVRDFPSEYECFVERATRNEKFDGSMIAELPSEAKLS